MMVLDEKSGDDQSNYNSSRMDMKVCSKFNGGPLTATNVNLMVAKESSVPWM